MRITIILAAAAVAVAAAAVSLPGPSAAATTPTAARTAQCEAQKKACLDAGAQTGQWGERYVPPDVVKRCYEAYRACQAG